MAKEGNCKDDELLLFQISYFVFIPEEQFKLSVACLIGLSTHCAKPLPANIPEARNEVTKDTMHLYCYAQVVVLGVDITFVTWEFKSCVMTVKIIA